MTPEDASPVDDRPPTANFVIIARRIGMNLDVGPIDNAHPAEISYQLFLIRHMLF